MPSTGLESTELKGFNNAGLLFISDSKIVNRSYLTLKDPKIVCYQRDSKSSLIRKDMKDTHVIIPPQKFFLLPSFLMAPYDKRTQLLYCRLEGLKVQWPYL